MVYVHYRSSNQLLLSASQSDRQVYDWKETAHKEVGLIDNEERRNESRTLLE